jgi:hypothetical protein
VTPCPNRDPTVPRSQAINRAPVPPPYRGARVTVTPAHLRQHQPCPDSQHSKRPPGGLRQASRDVADRAISKKVFARATT